MMKNSCLLILLFHLIFFSNKVYSAPTPKKPKYTRVQPPKPLPVIHCKRSTVDLALSTGYIWKNDHHFKKVYGQGIEDIITLDGCYWFSRYVGVGLKGSYWSADGKTTVLKKSTHVKEVPAIAYLRARIGCVIQLYGSLGVGGIYVHEKSYLGQVNTSAWCGEAEIGLNYYFAKHIYLTTAFRYLYSRKEIHSLHENADFGGYGIRGGLGCDF